MRLWLSVIAFNLGTRGRLLALHVTPADEQDRAQVGELARQVQQITEENVELAYVDQAYTGEAAEETAAEHGIQLEVVKHPEPHGRGSTNRRASSSAVSGIGRLFH